MPDAENMLEIDSKPALVAAPERAATLPLRSLVAWWLLGVLNNSAYVIMLAGATDISSASVGLVYLAAIAPGLLCKLTLPHWGHRAPLPARMPAVAALLAASVTTVALAPSRAAQLAGVALASLQGGLGEATCLALTSQYSGRPAITMWSSGTGFAGVFGYAWIALLHSFGGVSFRVTLLLANALAAAWLGVWLCLLPQPTQQQQQQQSLWRHSSDDAAGGSNSIDSAPYRADGLSDGGAAAGIGGEAGSGGEGQRLLPVGGGAGSAAPQQQLPDDGSTSSNGSSTGKTSLAARMTWRERVQRTVALWPYMVPLTVVYFAEYAMQSGTWTSIGFPMDSAPARARFYVLANWCYQGGVFLSRSSGMLYQASLRALWAMPLMQCAWLAFFLIDAVAKLWYDWTLLLPCFVTGLLGGAVYVNAFTLISKDVPPQYRDFSLGAASLADSLGIAAAAVAGTLIQGCLFRANGLSGADFQCSVT